MRIQEFYAFAVSRHCLVAEIDLEVGQVVVRFIRRDWHNELGDQKRLLIPPPLDDNHMAIHSVRNLRFYKLTDLAAENSERLSQEENLVSFEGDNLNVVASVSEPTDNDIDSRGRSMPRDKVLQIAEASSSESPSPPPPNPLSKLRRNYSEPAKLENLWDGIRRLDSEIESVFSSIRSQSDDDIEEELAKVNAYATAGPCRRAFPERFLALLVTLAVEVPVALIITGGSKELKSLVGLERYTLLMAFLPLTSAISGNVGLQASSLTTRAISHGCHRRGLAAFFLHLL
ncbi:Magnesium transporter MgtE [Durusdinium trenchii]|uniref:Magnesium transporter MgtE n=1 Tax=Durusdinium trenchii TaxID=1381693 RepID=A0ABP0I7H0_9DINO